MSRDRGSDVARVVVSCSLGTTAVRARRCMLSAWMATMIEIIAAGKSADGVLSSPVTMTPLDR